jgi:hypothetical protein
MDTGSIIKKIRQEKEDLISVIQKRDNSSKCGKEWHRWNRIAETKQRAIEHFQNRLKR